MHRVLIAVAVLLTLLACESGVVPVDETEPIPPGTVSALTLARGANLIGNADTWPTLDQRTVQTWQSWGITSLRINLDKDDFTNVWSGDPAADVLAPYTDNLAKLSAALGWFRSAGITVMVSLDHIWGDDHDTSSLWSNGGSNRGLNHRIDLCGAFAAWVAAQGFSDVVTRIELWNEPHPCDVELYKTIFLPRAVAAVRSANPAIGISIMPPSDWGLPRGFVGWDGIGDPAVEYSTHIYTPQTYTHQGVLRGYPLLAQGWPGEFRNYPDTPAQRMDIDAGRELIRVLTDFRARSGRPVVVTEFGVARWARRAGWWMRDLITVMEEAGIPWYIHSIAGWNGWNPSFRATEPESKLCLGDGSPSLELLKHYWRLP